MMTRVKLPAFKRRELFADDSNSSVDVRALLREWAQLQARYDHLPEFKEVIRRFFIAK